MYGGVREICYTMIQDDLQVACKLRELLNLEVLLIRDSHEDIMGDFAHVDSSWVGCVENGQS